MKQKQVYLTRSSFAFLAFVILGYMVKFYPQQLVYFDQSIQDSMRGSLPEGLTQFYRAITVLGNTSSQLILVLALAAFFYWIKKWKIESYFLLLNGALAGILIVGLKLVYARPRPSLTHLVEAGGFSFPSGHALGSFVIFGSLIIFVCQRVTDIFWRKMLVLFLSLVILGVGGSRIYLGVHYPSDVLAGFLVGYGLLNLIYPFYDQKRFEWRFQSKQK